MSLRDYKPVFRPVPGGGENFTVRGLSLTDLQAIADHHLTALELAVAKYRNSRERDEPLSMLIVHLLPTAADLVAAIIAHGCGEPDLAETAKSLPAAVQIAALDLILEMSFSGAGGPKKFVEMVSKMAISVGIQPTKLTGLPA